MHHTKEKGDLGNLKIAAEIASQGFKVLVPISEHLPFDLVAYDQNTGKLYKIQSKYSSVNKDNVLTIKLKTTHFSSVGTIAKRYEDNSFDILAVYCPDLNSVLFVSEKELQNLNCNVNFSINENPNGRYWKNYTSLKKAVEV